MPSIEEDINNILSNRNDFVSWLESLPDDWSGDANSFDTNIISEWVKNRLGENANNIKIYIAVPMMFVMYNDEWKMLEMPEWIMIYQRVLNNNLVKKHVESRVRELLGIGNDEQVDTDLTDNVSSTLLGYNLPYPTRLTGNKHDNLHAVNIATTVMELKNLLSQQ